MDPKNPFHEPRHDEILEGDVEREDDVGAAGSEPSHVPHSDRFHDPIAEREAEEEKREHGELTEE